MPPCLNLYLYLHISNTFVHYLSVIRLTSECFKCGRIEFKCCRIEFVVKRATLPVGTLISDPYYSSFYFSFCKFALCIFVICLNSIQWILNVLNTQCTLCIHLYVVIFGPMFTWKLVQKLTKRTQKMWNLAQNTEILTLKEIELYQIILKIFRGDVLRVMARLLVRGSLIVMWGGWVAEVWRVYHHGQRHHQLQQHGQHRHLHGLYHVYDGPHQKAINYKK